MNTDPMVVGGISMRRTSWRRLARKKTAIAARVANIDGLWVRSYPIGIGEDDSTPVGALVVRKKVENPPYDGPEGHFAPEDPDNPYGTDLRRDITLIGDRSEFGDAFLGPLDLKGRYFETIETTQRFSPQIPFPSH